MWERLARCRSNPQLNACFADEDFIRLMCSIAFCLHRRRFRFPYVYHLNLCLLSGRGFWMWSFCCWQNGHTTVPRSRSGSLEDCRKMIESWGLKRCGSVPALHEQAKSRDLLSVANTVRLQSLQHDSTYYSACRSNPKRLILNPKPQHINSTTHVSR